MHHPTPAPRNHHPAIAFAPPRAALYVAAAALLLYWMLAGSGILAGGL